MIDKQGWAFDVVSVDGLVGFKLTRAIQTAKLGN